MAKHLIDADSLQYKKQLETFMQSINPKPPVEVLEKLLNRYLEERNARETNKNSDH